MLDDSKYEPINSVDGLMVLYSKEKAFVFLI